MRGRRFNESAFLDCVRCCFKRSRMRCKAEVCCCSTDFTGTSLSLGRRDASAMAKASLWSADVLRGFGNRLADDVDQLGYLMLLRDERRRDCDCVARDPQGGAVPESGVENLRATLTRASLDGL